MQREASENPTSYGSSALRLITVVSRLVPFSTEYSTRFVALSYGALGSLTVLTPFYYVCHVKDIKWHIMGTLFLILEHIEYLTTEIILCTMPMKKK